MSKKPISLLLAVCMLFCLSACGTTEISSNPTNTPSESQTDTTQNTDKTTKTEPENNEASSNTENSKEDGTAQTQTPVNQSKPTSTTNRSTHTHSYSNATCTSPKKCSCGATAGTALGHQFSSATCTSPKICSRCGTTSGNALAHNHSAANCTSPKTCTRCGQTSGSALGHNYVNNKCSRCGKVDPESLPVGLDVVPVIDKDSYYPNETITNTYGKTYSNVHSFWGRNSYAIFNLNTGYSEFSGEITLSNTVASNHQAIVNIYADGLKIHTVSQINKLTDTITFKINVKDVKLLKIEVINKSEWVHLERCSIVNAQLKK